MVKLYSNAQITDNLSVLQHLQFLVLCGLCCGLSSGGRVSYIDGSSLLVVRSGNNVLYVVGDVTFTMFAAKGEGYDNGNDQNEGYKTPGHFLKHIGGLTYAEGLVAGYKVAGKTVTLTVLQKHYKNEECACDKNENCQGYKKPIHIFNLFIISSIFR